MGAPGIGKSRLLSEFTEKVAVDGSVHVGRCLSYGEGITYWPVIEIVKSAAGILQSDDEAEIAGRLAGLLDRLPTNDLDELRTMAAAVSNLAGVTTTPRGTYSATEITQAELHWGIRRLLRLLAVERPLVVVLEDLHWAEPTLLELARSLITSDAEARMLVLVTARPEVKGKGCLVRRSRRESQHDRARGADGELRRGVAGRAARRRGARADRCGGCAAA